MFEIKEKNLIVSVIVPCHNYGHFLSDCLKSILTQTRRPDEIIIVDDGSTDNTPEVSSEFAEQKVKYIRVENYNPNLTRKAGVNASLGDIVCTVDADDKLDPTYIEKGLEKFFQDSKTAIVYSDVQYFGERTNRTNYPASTDEADLWSLNFIHSGALVWKNALIVADAFNHGDQRPYHEDWVAWRKIIQEGFRAVKQESIYYYNQHPRSIGKKRYGADKSNYNYYEAALFAKERLTLFIPLAGRVEFWPKLKNFLENQTWPHNLITLILMDTANNKEFSQNIKSWLINSDYKDFRYLKQIVGEENLADKPRKLPDGRSNSSIVRDVRLTMAKIYNRIARIVESNFLWILEDDIIPPLDVAERLFKNFCPLTASVAASYNHRYQNAYVVWDKNRNLKKEGSGVEEVGGNGFGCAIFRTNVFKRAVFSFPPQMEDPDIAFYEHFLNKNEKAKVDWSISCEHLSKDYSKIEETKNDYECYIPETENTTQNEETLNAKLIIEITLSKENFDEEYYLLSNQDVRAAVARGEYKSGFEHYAKYGYKEKRDAKSL